MHATVPLYEDRSGGEDVFGSLKLESKFPRKRLTHFRWPQDRSAGATSLRSTCSEDRMRRECVGGSYVFIKDHASSECTDTREPGRNEVRAKIAEAVMHLVIRLLALRESRAKDAGALTSIKSMGCLSSSTVNDAIASIASRGGLREVVLGRDFEWTLEAENMVGESSVWSAIGAFIGDELRLVNLVCCLRAQRSKANEKPGQTSTK